MRIVRTRSIGNVDADRLVDSLAQLHRILHTPEGLRAWDDTRRALIEHGIKARRIRAELRARAVAVPECRHCDGPPPLTPPVRQGTRA